MKYDIGMHIPTQVEALLIAYQKNPVDLAGMERALENIKNLVKDSKFHKDLNDYSKKRLDQLNQMSKKAFDAAKTIASAKDFNEIYIDVQEIGKDLSLAVDNVEKDFWNHIKDYITLYLNKSEKDVDEESDDEI
jgi:DNA repair ATPase RecN